MTYATYNRNLTIIGACIYIFPLKYIIPFMKYLEVITHTHTSNQNTKREKWNLNWSVFMCVVNSKTFWGRDKKDVL